MMPLDHHGSQQIYLVYLSLNSELTGHLFTPYYRILLNFYYVLAETTETNLADLYRMPQTVFHIRFRPDGPLYKTLYVAPVQCHINLFSTIPACFTDNAEPVNQKLLSHEYYSKENPV